MNLFLRSAFAAAIALLLGFGTAGSLSADSACQGLSSSSCNANDDCTWVSGYTRQDGVSVNAYCRAKPGKAGDGERKTSKKNKDDDEDSGVKEKKSKKKKDKDDDGDEDKKSKRKKKDKNEDESDNEDDS
ncbi:hypothetical protein, partial [Leptospira ellisii]